MKIPINDFTVINMHAFFMFGYGFLYVFFLLRKKINEFKWVSKKFNDELQ